MKTTQRRPESISQFVQIVSYIWDALFQALAFPCIRDNNSWGGETVTVVIL